VVGLDNFSTGQAEFIVGALQNPNFRLVRGDLLDPEALPALMTGLDAVFHLAANADVRFGLNHPRLDVDQNILATLNLLEAMRAGGVRRLAFVSTGSVYGEPGIFPTPEDAPLPVQTSLYGASKLAAEGLIEAYSEGFGFRSCIFRLVSVLGERYSHGHVYDFVRSLKEDPSSLMVLGDGCQTKSYIYVEDCVAGILTGHENGPGRVNIFNLGTAEACTVNDSIGWITRELKLEPKLSYAGGKRGWVGDSPRVLLDCSRLRALGWKPKTTIREGVARTVAYLRQNPWLLARR
jgi:UDP-glucose 4-epimerase